MVLYPCLGEGGRGGGVTEEEEEGKEGVKEEEEVNVEEEEGKEAWAIPGDPREHVGSEVRVGVDPPLLAGDPYMALVHPGGGLWCNEMSLWGKW